jgi:hypothetical protein
LPTGKRAKPVKNPDVRAVELRAELRQVKSMADGTFNVVLNVPEDCTEQVKVLLDWLKLEVRIVISNSDISS